MVLRDLLPKVYAPKKVVFDHWKLNALYYALHLPILAYAIFIFEYQKQYTEVISNAPFLMLHVDALDALPFDGVDPAADPEPSLAGWCRFMTGGPFSCWNSTPYVESLCLNLTNADIQSQIEVQVSLACSRLCPLGGSLDPTCFLPPTNFQQAGSRTLTIYPFTAVGTGLISGGQLQPMFILLHPLVRHATVEFTYVFQMTQAAPFFFGLYDSASGRRNQDKAYTAVVNQHEHVKHFFAPDEKVLLSPVDIIRAAGREWNVETLMLGAEFYAEVNCYSDGYDLSASMDWSNFTYVAPTPDVPLCIMTVEQLQGAAVSSTMDGINDVILSQSRFRIDTGRGSSHHRMPSVSAILLNLISLFVLLKVPQAVTMLFAHMCLGSLSKVYKRASEETFKLPTRIAQLGLRLVSDSLALAALRNSESSGITEERLKEELRKVISATAAEPSVHLDKIGDYYGDHVFMILRDIARQGHCDGDLSGAVQSGQFANLMSLGQTVHIRDLVAYFDTQRRRSWMEWWFLPRPHRLQIKKMRADDKATGEEAQPSAATSGVKLVADLDSPDDGWDNSKKQETEPPPAYVDAASVRSLQARLEVLEAEKEAFGKTKEVVAGLAEKLQSLSRRLDSLDVTGAPRTEERVEAEKSPADLVAQSNATEKSLKILAEKADVLEQRLAKVETGQAKVAGEVGTLRVSAEQRQENVLKELEAVAAKLKRHLPSAENSPRQADVEATAGPSLTSPLPPPKFVKYSPIDKRT